jgi:hypothetical protein
MKKKIYYLIAVQRRVSNIPRRGGKGEGNEPLKEQVYDIVCIVCVYITENATQMVYNIFNILSKRQSILNKVFLFDSKQL